MLLKKKKSWLGDYTQITTAKTVASGQWSAFDGAADGSAVPGREGYG